MKTVTNDITYSNCVPGCRNAQKKEIARTLLSNFLYRWKLLVRTTVATTTYYVFLLKKQDKLVIPLAKG